MSLSSSSSSQAWHCALGTFCSTGSRGRAGLAEPAMADGGQALGAGTAQVSHVGHRDTTTQNTWWHTNAHWWDLIQMARTRKIPPSPAGSTCKEGGGESTAWVHGLQIPESFRQRHPETLLGTLARGSPGHHSPPTVANNSCVFILCHQMTRKKSWLFNALVILASSPLLPGGCSHHPPSLWVPMSRTLGWPGCDTDPTGE